MDDRYVAGIFDGEGYVRIARWRKPNSVHVRYQVFLGINMTWRPLIEAIHQKYEGRIHHSRHDLRNPNHRILFGWTASDGKACAFLRRMHPYLTVKKDEADIALQLQAHIKAHPYKPAGKLHLRDNRDELLAFREDLFQRITALKKRSFPPLTT